MDYRRTHHCDELRLSHKSSYATLSGWVHRRRDHGNLIFIDLRDRFGLTQLIFDPTLSKESHEKASELRPEWVITARGKVRSRGEGLENRELATGKIEVAVEELDILAKAHTPPFSLSDKMTEANEDIRLRYRYLDIRRGDIGQKLAMRHRAMLSTRTFFDRRGFLEVNTPLLGRSTPEGARDYLIPSRIHPGKFYALPQSPQLFKQLLMVGGIDRYLQIAPCFRDEDLRADRQPEFTQIDLEMSFGYPEDMRRLIDDFLTTLFKECIGHAVPEEIPTMSYRECLEYYGTDRPDLRFAMRLHRIDDIAAESAFSIFRDQLQKGGIVKGICVKGGGALSRRDIERYTAFVAKLGLQGLCWMKREEGGFSSNVVKFFSPALQQALETRMEAHTGDLLLFAAASAPIVNRALDHLRRLIGKERNLIDPNRYAFLWVTDFPLFEWSESDRRLQSAHHPFTHPHPEDYPLLEADPTEVRALSYDIVINGYEVGGGSQRIHDCALQKKIFQLLQLPPEEIESKFGFFLEALNYGTPPHLGIALGFDRLLMLLTKTENIRDIIAFPKTQKASDLMMQSPSTVSDTQLRELHIRVQ